MSLSNAHSIHSSADGLRTFTTEMRFRAWGGKLSPIASLARFVVANTIDPSGRLKVPSFLSSIKRKQAFTTAFDALPISSSIKTIGLSWWNPNSSLGIKEHTSVLFKLRIFGTRKSPTSLVVISP